MSDKSAREQELERNYAAFATLQPALLADHAGKFALMRHGNLEKIFDSAVDAAIFAEAQFEDDLWSLQEISAPVVDLGWFSHAMPHIAL